jgi:hypothetical protein
MGKMKPGYDRRDEVLGARLREAMEDLSKQGEPDFASIELAAASPDAMPASVRTARNKPSWALLLIPVAAAVVLVLGLGRDHLAGARMAANDDHVLDGMSSGSSLDDPQADPLGTEVSLLARESVGGDLSLPPADSGGSGSFDEELAVFVTGLWKGPDTAASLSWREPSESVY